MVCLLKLFHSYWKFCFILFILFFFSLCFILGSFTWQIFKFTHPFIYHIQCTDKLSKDICISSAGFFSSLAFPLDPFLEFPSFSLHFSSVATCCLRFLHFFLDILIRVISDSLSNNSNTYVTSESGSDACFSFRFHIFLFSLSFSFQSILKIFFCWKTDMMYQIKGAEVRTSQYYVNLIRNWIVLQVYYHCRCHRLQIPLVPLFLSLLITLGFLRLLRESLQLPALYFLRHQKEKKETKDKKTL